MSELKLFCNYKKYFCVSFQRILKKMDIFNNLFLDLVLKGAICWVDNAAKQLFRGRKFAAFGKTCFCLEITVPGSSDSKANMARSLLACLTSSPTTHSVTKYRYKDKFRSFFLSYHNFA